MLQYLSLVASLQTLNTGTRSNNLLSTPIVTLWLKNGPFWTSKTSLREDMLKCHRQKINCSSLEARIINQNSPAVSFSTWTRRRESVHLKLHLHSVAMETSTATILKVMSFHLHRHSKELHLSKSKQLQRQCPFWKDSEHEGFKLTPISSHIKPHSVNQQYSVFKANWLRQVTTTT